MLCFLLCALTIALLLSLLLLCAGQCCCVCAGVCRLQVRAGLYEYEMALLANLVPQELEEAFALVPSLRVSQPGRPQHRAVLACNIWVPVLVLDGY
jgi:hypothetical protein